MTEKTFTFNIDQVKAIFRAGVSRGAEEECAFQCGGRVSSKEFDELVNVIYDIVNEDKKWGEDGHTEFDVIESWFERKK